MRRHPIPALSGRRFRLCTTDSRHYLPIAPNLLAQHFVAMAPNRIWLADIRYIATGEGWLYLAAVLDLATRKIVGETAQGSACAASGIANDERQLQHRYMRAESMAGLIPPTIDGEATSLPSAQIKPQAA